MWGLCFPAAAWLPPLPRSLWANACMPPIRRQTGVRHWAIAPGLGLWEINSEYRTQILFGAIFFAATLPSAVVAWTEPDAIPNNRE